MTKWNRLTKAILASSLLLASGITSAADSRLEDFEEKESERREGVDLFVTRHMPFTPAAEMVNSGCAANCQAWDVVEDSNGELQDYLLSPMEIYVLAQIAMDPRFWASMAEGYMEGQKGINKAFTGDEDPTGGLAALNSYFSKEPEDRDGDELISAGGNAPWLDPFSMIGAGAFMMGEVSSSIREAEDRLAKRTQTVDSERRRRQSMMDQLELGDVEEFAGVPTATRWDSTAPPTPMGEAEGQQVTYKDSKVWFDHDRQLMLGHRFEGTLTENGESRDFYIQTTNLDFRNPPGCHDMIKPYKRVMEMGGMLNDEQMAEMKEAQKQLAEFDKQMAAMPASQRQMMENMMGGQMETVRNMAESGSLSHTMETEEILCNPDLKALYAPMGGAGLIEPSADGLLVQIQKDLKTLGYEPGNTDGVLDTMTQVAISQFQAESGLAVTGEPSQELANALATAVGR